MVLDRGDIGVDEIQEPDDIEQPQYRDRDLQLVAQTCKRREREQRRSEIAIGGRNRESLRQIGRDKARHQEHQAVDAQARVQEKRREGSCGRAIFEAGPDVPFREEDENDVGQRIADQVAAQVS